MPKRAFNWIVPVAILTMALACNHILGIRPPSQAPDGGGGLGGASSGAGGTRGIGGAGGSAGVGAKGGTGLSSGGGAGLGGGGHSGSAAGGITGSSGTGGGGVVGGATGQAGSGAGGIAGTAGLAGSGGTAGICVNSSCTPYTCGTSACKTTCASNTDCISTAYTCSGGACIEAVDLTVNLLEPNDSPATSDWIYFDLEIINNGSSAVPLSQLTGKYWYTWEDTGSITQGAACTYANGFTGSCSNIVLGPFAALSPVQTGADHSFQFGFATAAGSLAAGANITFEIGFHKNDFSNYAQTDDYSFNGASTLTTTTAVTFYLDGMLVYGIEPTGITGADAGTDAGGTSGQADAGGGSGSIILSIDFIGGSVPAGADGGALVAAPAMAATESAGVKPAMNWNGAASNAGTLTSLREADGTPTAVSVTWNSPSMGTDPGEWKNIYPDAPGNARMMNGFLDPPDADVATITVNGLPAAITAGHYDVYVYMAGDIPYVSTRTYQYSIASTTFTVSQSGISPATFPGFTLAPAGGAGNYVVFRNLSGSTFTLTATPGTGAPSRAPVNGMQIVSPTGS